MRRHISYRELWDVPHLPALLAATVLSRLAGRMLALTLVLYTLALYGSPALAGWLAFAAIGPGLAASPLAGALLDRVGPVRAIAADLAASAALVAALVAADRLGWASPALLLALAAAFSLTSPLSAAGVRTLLARLAPPPARDRVNALDTATFALVDVAGPGVAGLLAGLVGPAACLLLIAGTYGAAGLCLRGVRLPPDDRPAPRPLLRRALEGMVVVARQPTLRGLALSYSLYQVTWGVLFVLLPVIARRHFGASAGSSVAGLLWAATGLAGGVGALVAGHLRISGRERAVMAAGMAATALAAWPVAAAFGPGGLAAGLLVAGAAAGPIDVGLLTLRQRRTRPDRLGRVLSISISLNIAGFPLGAALAGMLLDRSVPATFLLAAAASLLAAIAVLAIPGSPGDPETRRADGVTGRQ